MALDLQPGDEVITPAYTYIATAEAAVLLKLKVVLADVDPDTFTLSPESLQKAVSRKTKAIIPVHLYGQCAPMDAIIKLAEEKNIAIIEDSIYIIDYQYSISKKVFCEKPGTLWISYHFSLPKSVLPFRWLSTSIDIVIITLIKRPNKILFCLAFQKLYKHIIYSCLINFRILNLSPSRILIR